MDSQPNAARCLYVLRTLAKKFGLKVSILAEDDYGEDVSFDRKTIRIGYNATVVEQEERLAHELGHFLVAPPSRRFRPDYGHRTMGLSYDYLDNEELAAAVLGITLQKHFKGHPTLRERAYLWNSGTSKFLYGFWMGAETLVKRGWLLDGFNLNAAKLKEFYVKQ